MIRLAILFSILLVSSLLSCSTGEKNTEVSSFLNGFEGLSTTESCSVVILPFSGCTGCISSVEFFVKENVFLDSSLYVVVTNLPFKKQASLRYGEEFMRHPRVYVDEENRWPTSGIQSDIYPALVHIEEGRIIGKWEVSPDFDTALEDFLQARESK